MIHRSTLHHRPNPSLERSAKRQRRLVLVVVRTPAPAQLCRLGVMTKLAFLVPLMVSSGFACAAEERMRLVQPRGGNLTLVQLERDNDLLAKFSGQTWISGTFVGRWPGGTKSVEKRPEYALIPDKQSRAKLPYFVLKEPGYVHQYRVEAIDVQNGEAALRMVVSEEKANRLVNRKVSVVRATGQFLVESFSVGVECDAPWARAVLLKVQLPSQVAVIHQTIPERC